jgi:hypothetical protein
MSNDLATRGNKYLHPNNLLEKIEKIVSGNASVPVRLTAILPGMNVTIVLKDGHRVVRGIVKNREVDRITIETAGLSETFKKHEIHSILGRPVKGGTRRKARRAQKKTRRVKRS